MSFSIVTADRSHQLLWDEYVSQHSDATPYHAYAWLAAVEEAYQHKNSSLIAIENDQIVGVLPAVQMSTPLVKPRLVSLPFCDMGYPLADNEHVRKSLVQAYQQLAVQLKAKNCELRDYQREAEFGDVEAGRKVSMLLPLPGDKDVLWDSFKSKLRSQVRKAEKNGLSSEQGNSPELLNEFYDVFAQNMRKLGSPVHSKRWFEALSRHYQDNLVIGVVRNNGECIGAGIVLTVGDRMAIPWASTLAEHNRLSPNMMLYWDFLALACDKGKSIFDFGRSSFGEGTFKFKQQWGAEPRPLAWIDFQQPESSVSSEASNDGASGLRAKVEQVWAKLPLPMTKLIGPQVRKHISL